MEKEIFYIYTKEGCIFCDQIKQVLSLKGFKYEERKLQEDYNIDEFKQRFKSNKFPQVVYENENLGGCIETIKYLKSNKMIT